MVREAILTTAFDLFYKNGFHAVGVDVIAKESGITRQTLYNHFESRDQLILEVITRRDQWWRREFGSILRQRGGDDPINQLRAIAPAIREWLADRDFKGCLFISAAAEFPNPNDPVHLTAKNNLEAIRSTIEHVAELAGFDDVNTFAHKFVVLIQGAIIVEVIDRENAAGEQLCQLADMLIDAQLDNSQHSKSEQ